MWVTNKWVSIFLTTKQCVPFLHKKCPFLCGRPLCLVVQICIISILRKKYSKKKKKRENIIFPFFGCKGYLGQTWVEIVFLCGVRAIQTVQLTGTNQSWVHAWMVESRSGKHTRAMLNAALGVNHLPSAEQIICTYNIYKFQRWQWCMNSEI